MIMFKKAVTFVFIFSGLLVFMACSDTKDSDMASIEVTPVDQTCNLYDASADNSNYTSGTDCDNDDKHYIQFEATGTKNNDETEDLTNSSLVTWTVEDDKGDTATLLSDSINGLAYLNQTGVFNIIATYEKAADNDNEDDIILRDIVTLTIE